MEQKTQHQGKQERKTRGEVAEKEKREKKREEKENKGRKKKKNPAVFSLDKADHPAFLSKDFLRRFSFICETIDFCTLSDVRKAIFFQKYRRKNTWKTTPESDPKFADPVSLVHV